MGADFEQHFVSCDINKNEYKLMEDFESKLEKYNFIQVQLQANLDNLSEYGS